MGRPTKYSTEEERKAAKRAQDKRAKAKYAQSDLGKERRIDQKKREYEARKKKRDLAYREREFVGIDGEGLGQEGYHLLALSTGAMIENRSKEGLSSLDCLRFLLDNRSHYLVGYGISYDVTHWLKTLPVENLREVWKTGMTTVRIPHATGDGGDRRTIRYIPNKLFQIGFMTKENQFIPLVKVHDLCGFAQCSFLQCIEPNTTDANPRGWGLVEPEERSILEWGKEARGHFCTEVWDEMVAYNQTEMEIMARMAGRIRDGLLPFGIRPRDWHGSGAVAQAELSRRKVADLLQPYSDELWDAWTRAFFGGWFQAFQTGCWDRAWDYDVRGAYPSVCITLPSAKGEWERVTELSDAEWGVYRVKWDVGKRRADNPLWPLTPFPWRGRISEIHRPHRGHGWYCAQEVKQAVKLWPEKIEVQEGWILHPEQEGVFRWMENFNTKRIEAKVALKNPNLSEEERNHFSAIDRLGKLGYNSLYGKFCQAVGKAPFMEPFYAATITGTIRAKVLAAAALDPTAVIGIQTDGLTTSRPLPLDLADVPGGWEETKDSPFEEFVFIQSGVYFYKGKQRDHYKFRGGGRPTPKAGTQWDWKMVKEHWEKNGPELPLRSFREVFYTVGAGMARCDPSLIGTWKTESKAIQLRPGGTDVLVSKGKVMRWKKERADADYSELSAPYKPMLKYRETPEDVSSTPFRADEERLEEEGRTIDDID